MKAKHSAEAATGDPIVQETIKNGTLKHVKDFAGVTKTLINTMGTDRSPN